MIAPLLAPLLGSGHGKLPFLLQVPVSGTVEVEAAAVPCLLCSHIWRYPPLSFCFGFGLQLFRTALRFSLSILMPSFIHRVLASKPWHLSGETKGAERKGVIWPAQNDSMGYCSCFMGRLLAKKKKISLIKNYKLNDIGPEVCRPTGKLPAMPDEKSCPSPTGRNRDSPPREAEDLAIHAATTQ